MQGTSAVAHVDGERSSAITGIRGLAALAVMLGHSKGAFPGLFPGGYFQPNGYAAVGVFFALSGYLMRVTNSGCSMDRSECRRRFWIKRAARILPAYYLCLLLSLPNVLPVGSLSATGTAYAVLSFLGIQSILPASQPTMSVVAWSLSVEMAFYFVYPWVHRCLTKHEHRHRLHLMIALLVCVLWSSAPLLARAIVGCSALTAETAGYFYYTWMFRLSEFAVAIVVTELYLHTRRRERQNYRPIESTCTLKQLCFTVCAAIVRFFLQLSVIALLSGLPLLPPIAPYMCRIFDFSALSPLYAVFIVSLTVDNRDPIVWLLSAPPLVDLGEISYGVYLFHPWLMEYVFANSWQPGRPLQGLFSFCVLTFGFCAMLHRYWEQPLYAWFTRKLNVGKCCACQTLTQATQALDEPERTDPEHTI